MTLPSKVFWFEGLPLAPQQFQQQDLYHEARLQRLASALNPLIWGVRSVTWDTVALTNNALHASAMSLIFQDGEVYEASATEKLPTTVDLGALPGSEQQCTFYAALPQLNTYGHNLSHSIADHGARYAQHDSDTADLYSEAISTPVLYLQKNVRLLSQFESRDAYISFPIVRIRRNAGGGFELDPTFFPPCLSTGGSEGLQAMLERLLTQLYVKIDTLYGRHAQTSKDVFAIQNGDITAYLMLNTLTTACASLAHSVRHRSHHPEIVFDKLSTLAGGLLAFSRRYSIATFPVYKHDDAAPGFLKLDAMIRDLIDVTISSKYHVIALVMDPERHSRYSAVLHTDNFNADTTLGLAVSADMPALELIAALPMQIKISSPSNIDDLIRHAASGVRVMHMAQVPSAVPVRPNTHYFILENKGTLYESILKMQALSIYVPAGLEGLKIELFSLTP